ncbi:MAG: helix-turn-helix domain-containing protein, partial [Clostridiales bacterium]|nr:helix-turn-helix domain-containing protein [Clostridiales bacterium]
MDDEKVKSQIGANIAACRKRIGLTQAGLAEKLNYSDKAISKWE